jgi:hypothetical protein
MSAQWLRIFKHLLPTGRAWRLVAEKTLTKFFEGLTEPYSDARDFVDGVYNDLRPEYTRELSEWETQFGIDKPATNEDDRRDAIASTWAATGGQSPNYLQTVLQNAGFNVWVHEWWEGANVAPRTVRDPRLYTNTPVIGPVQCGRASAQCGRAGAQCNGFLANDPKYLVRSNLTPVAPPAIPNNENAWRFFWYVGGETFGESAVVEASRRVEFERLIYKYKPAHTWVVELVLFESGYVPGLFYFGGGDGFSGGAWGGA